MASKTLVDTDSTQTLTNKTLTSPTLTTPDITGGSAGAVLQATSSAASSFRSPFSILYAALFIHP